MTKKTIRYSDNQQAELGKLLRSIGYRHGLWQVFRDFVAMAAFALSNAVDKRNYEHREAEYLKIVSRYTKEEADTLARGLAHVVMGLEMGFSDFLGSLFMSLELGDSWKGQFFTPYEVSRLMAAITMGDKAQSEIEAKGFITVSDPCIGGGAMVIAAAHAMMDAGINYQKHMHAVALDIDIVSVHMSYIQLSLLHIPAVIYHGNSLSCEVWSEWRTPAHVLGFWDSKLRRADAQGGPVETIPAPAEQDAPPTLGPLAAAVNLRDQLALF